MRLTTNVRQHLLNQNEGYTTSTSYSGKNLTEDRTYEIQGGELHIRATGKTSRADSRYEEVSVADDEQTKRFLRSNLGALNTDGVD